MNRKTTYLVLAVIISLTACGNQQYYQDHEASVKVRFTPVSLNQDTTVLTVKDYILRPELLESVSVSDNSLAMQLSKNKELLTLITNSNAPKISVLNFHLDKSVHSVLLKKSDKVAHSIKVKLAGANTIQLKGEMNAWNPANTILSKDGDSFTTSFYLSPGRYQYLLVVDGKEMLDPSNTKTIANNLGGFNSLIEIAGNEEKTPKLSTHSYSNNIITLKKQNNVDNIYAFLDNHLINVEHINISDEFVKITVPQMAAQKERTHLRVYASNNFGVSKETLIPLNNGNTVKSTTELNRHDKHAQIIYFMMIDRFVNGDSLNDLKVNDPEIHPKANYHGGDLAGIVNKIEDGYFKALGINTLWLSPITQNPLGAYGLWPEPRTTFSGYHGYWPISSVNIDFRFGNDSILRELIKQSHDNEMNVLLDYVANHVHEEHSVYVNNPHWATSLYLPDGTLNTEKWDEHRLTTWFDTFLPTLDFSKPEVIEAMTDSAMYWLTSFNLDGFRHDATKHIDLPFWRTLTYKAKTQAQKTSAEPLYQIGETYGSRELINSYVNSGMLDAQFDFNLYDDAVATFAKSNTTFKRLSSSLKESQKYYGQHNLMGIISGNQDRARFITYAGGQVSFNEDAKAAGWTRNIEMPDSDAYGKMLQLLAFNLTVPGIPCIYYGDEFGMYGANDPDNRRMMRFNDALSDNEKQLLQYTQKLVKLRNDNMALLFGDWVELHLTDNLWIYSRNYFNNTVIVALNKSEEILQHQVTLPGKSATEFNDLFSGKKLNVQEGTLNIKLVPNKPTILFN